MSASLLSVDFPAFIKYALPVMMKGYPVMMRGRHGIGKSAVVYQLVDDIGYNAAEKSCMFMKGNESLDLVPYKVIERRVSQMTEGDLLGIPDQEGFDINGKLASKFRPFAWLVEACTAPVVLFLDELDRGIQEVRQGFFELADSRKIAGWELHPGTVIVSAINGGGDDAANYQVNELGLAEADRWATFDLKPSVEDFINWGKKGNLNSLVMEFITAEHDHLEHNGAIEPGAKYPSRRSWKRLNDCLESSGFLDEDTKDTRAIRFMGDSFVGIEAAGSFADFVDTYQFQVTPDDIVNKGMYKKTVSFTINQHLALADKIERSDILKPLLSKAQLTNFANWMVLVPSEVGMKMFNALSSGPNENTIELHAMTVDGISMVDRLTEMLSGTDAAH